MRRDRSHPADVEAVACAIFRFGEWPDHPSGRQFAGEVPADVRRRSEHRLRASGRDSTAFIDTTITLPTVGPRGTGPGTDRIREHRAALLPDHGGTLLNRVAADGIDGRPTKSIDPFHDASRIDGYLPTPRTVMAADRDRAIARTETLPSSAGCDSRDHVATDGCSVTHSRAR